MRRIARRRGESVRLIAKKSPNDEGASLKDHVGHLSQLSRHRRRLSGLDAVEEAVEEVVREHDFVDGVCRWCGGRRSEFLTALLTSSPLG